MNNAMNEQELLLKTAFACMACDGEIAPSEVERIREYALNNDRFTSLNVEDCLKRWVEEINLRGVRFLRDYVMTLRNSHVSEEQALDMQYQGHHAPFHRQGCETRLSGALQFLFQEHQPAQFRRFHITAYRCRGVTPSRILFWDGSLRMVVNCHGVLPPTLTASG